MKENTMFWILYGALAFAAFAVVTLTMLKTIKDLNEAYEEVDTLEAENEELKQTIMRMI